jgi:ABC-2 type transport system permease protein
MSGLPPAGPRTEPTALPLPPEARPKLAALLAWAYRAGGSLSPLVELRARLVWRRFVTGKGKLEAMALTVLFAMAVPLGFLFAVMVGAGSFRAARTGAGIELDSLAVIFFGLWQAWTALALTLSDREALELRRYLAFPIPPGRTYLFGLASGLLGDPASLFWLILLGGVFGGAALARPGLWLVGLAVTLFGFAAATLTLIALLQELLTWMLRSRGLRDLAIATLIIATVSLMASAVSGGLTSLREALFVLVRLRWFAFPAALSSEAARALYGHQPLRSLPWLALLGLATLLAGWLAFRLALASALSSGDGAEVRRAPGPLGRLSFLRGRFGALLEKDLRLLLRHPLVRVYGVVVPALACIVTWQLAPRLPENAREMVRGVPLLSFALYTHLVLQIFWLNAFGWERGGARLLYLAPVSPPQVLLSKNLALLIVSAGIFATSAALTLLVGDRPPLWAVVAAGVLQLAGSPVLFGLGNLVGVLNPKAASFGLKRGVNISSLSALAGMGILSVAGSLFGIPVLIALRLGEPWLLSVGWAVVGAGAFAVYWKTLPAAGRLLVRRREEVLSVVCGDSS